jgi:hypothetical protein
MVLPPLCVQKYCGEAFLSVLDDSLGDEVVLIDWSLDTPQVAFKRSSGRDLPRSRRKLPRYKCSLHKVTLAQH